MWRLTRQKRRGRPFHLARSNSATRATGSLGFSLKACDTARATSACKRASSTAYSAPPSMCGCSNSWRSMVPYATWGVDGMVTSSDWWGWRLAGLATGGTGYDRDVRCGRVGAACGTCSSSLGERSRVSLSGRTPGILIGLPAVRSSLRGSAGEPTCSFEVVSSAPGYPAFASFAPSSKLSGSVPRQTWSTSIRRAAI